MRTTKTIRVDAHKKIAKILAGCQFIRVYHYDDMGDDMRDVTAEEVSEAGIKYEWSRVYQDQDGTLHLSVHGNWSFTAYPTFEIAASKLIPQAVKEYRLMERIAERDRLLAVK